MSKLIEDLKAAGWVETTLGECRAGDEVVIVHNGRIRHEVITRVDLTQGTVSDARGFLWAAERPAQRSPRPEYAPGTVALVRIPGGTSPVRASRYNNGWIHERGWVSDMKMLSHGGEVVRVLLPADQDTPPIEVTDEMVERAAEACYLARDEVPSFCPKWDDVCERFPAAAALYRKDARAALEAALEKEK